MKLLLDTQYWLWWFTQPELLNGAAMSTTGYAYVFAISAIAPPTLLIWQKCHDNQWTMPNELYLKVVA